MTNSYKKEYPFVGYAGFGGGVGALAVKSAASKPYVDDVFSVDAWIGNASTKTITNGIDLSGEGGMVWAKRRNASSYPQVFDTTRGATKQLASSDNMAEFTATDSLTAFNDNGFTLGLNAGINGSGDEIVGWTFREQKGFFDVVSFTGTGSVRTISHSLGCIPGMIMIKNVDSVNSWFTYHRELGPSSYVMLNHTNAAYTSQSWFMNDTAPTATEFTLGTGGNVNESGDEFIAYLFAGGESDAATARSVDFDGNGDYLNIAASSDFDIETNWTAECWFKSDALNTSGDGYDCIMGNWESSQEWLLQYSGTTLGFYNANTSSKTLGTTDDAPLGQWNHVAISKQGSTTRIFLNGTQVVADFDMGTIDSSSAFQIGACSSGAGYFNGQISNVRIVKGTAVYTSSFRPPYEPLTNITNTKLLCCNNSSNTGSTVTPGTITANGNLDPLTTSPFDDSAGFKFGADENENIVKCGSYPGTGSSGLEINLGWEPQWILIKGTGNVDSWVLFDSMRGIVSGGYDMRLSPNLSNAEETDYDYLELTSTGFKLTVGQARTNNSGVNYIYMAIRSSDGYVGKLPSAGTGVFTMDTGNSSSTIPTFDSNFIVDFALRRQTNGTDNWDTCSRLTGPKRLKTNETDAEGGANDAVFDSNVGWNNGGFGTNNQSWMWKRGSGFDVVCYDGDGSWGRGIPHSLNQVPEMMWLKQRNNNGEEWVVYHKGLDGGTAPETHYLFLHSTAAEADADWPWNDTAPTSTHFTLGGGNATNGANDDQIAFLFASANDADGNPISKVGYYDGTGSVGLQITTGFSPRFLILKKTNGSGPWYVLDTTRGWAAGNDQYLQLDTTDAQVAYEFGAPNATGFQLDITASQVNESGGKYIYYAHA